MKKGKKKGERENEVLGRSVKWLKIVCGINNNVKREREIVVIYS